MNDNVCMIRDGMLIVGLHDGLLLKVQLNYYPLDDNELPVQVCFISILTYTC